MIRLINRGRPLSIFLLLLTLAWIAYIWLYRFLPMMDYPLWLCAGKIFSQFLHGQHPASYRLDAWPIPNSAFVGLVGLLDLVFSPEVSGKIFLTACTVMYVLGAYLLTGSLAPDRHWALSILPMLFLFHRCVWAGELSFSFGLGFLLIAMAMALRARRESPLIILFVSIGLFYSHAIAYFCWLIFLGTLCIFDSSRFSRLRTTLAVIPSLLLLALYALRRDYPSGIKTDLGPMSALRETPRFWSLFSPLHFFDPFYATDPQWIKYAAVLFNSCVVALVGALIGLWLWKLPARIRNGNGSVKAVLLTALIFFVIFAVFPFQAFTGVFDFNYRFLLPAFVLVLASLAPVLHPHRAFSAGITSAAVLVLAFHLWYTARISKELVETYQVMSQANLDPGFRDITWNPFEPLAPIATTGERLLPVHEPLMYFAQYLRLDRDWLDRNPRMFTTSFVRSTGSFSPLLGESKWRSPPPCAIVILGLQSQNRDVARLLPNEYRVSVEADYLLILQFDHSRSGLVRCS